LDFLSPFLQDKFNPLHVPMACQAAVAILPPDCHVAGFSSDDGANVGRVAIKTNKVASF
jgi:hypothetical protein